MRISGLPPANPGRVRGKRTDAARFEPTGSAPAPAAGGGPVQPPTSIDMLVALAAVDEEQDRRRRMAAEAERGLDMLEALEAELSAGSASAERLEEIAAWVSRQSVPEDPGLARLQRDIELRARVELEKHRRG